MTDASAHTRSPVFAEDSSAAPADRQEAIRAAIADALRPLLKDGAVRLPSIAHICRAGRAS
ncbi:MAG TPA: hypothetical protein VKV73_19390 [Chloroflexota bacterium]|nr:hypothetical protein [Chloroflexota bacterium]